MTKNELQIEQYKVFVDSINKVSEKRVHASAFFISIFAGLLAGLSFLAREGIDGGVLVFSINLLSAVGILLNIVWFLVIRSYKRLNKAKFIALETIEKDLPYHPFKVEWKHIKDKTIFPRHFRSSDLEMAIPFIAILPFLVIILYMNWEFFMRILGWDVISSVVAYHKALLSR